MSSRYGEFFRKYARNRGALAGLVFVIFFLALAALASLVAPGNPLRLGVSPFAPPSIKSIMGTDYLGRDVFALVAYGGRVSLTIGFVSAIISTAIGTLIGSVAGYAGGLTDDALMRMTELFQIIPGFFLALILVLFLGATVNNIVFALGITIWPRMARVVRSEVYSLKEREFVQSARTLGAGNVHLIFREILPNVVSSIVVISSLEVGYAILAEAGLSFLGLGDTNSITWGQMLQNAQIYLTTAWWMAFFPGMALFFTVLGLNLIGDGLGDALKP